MAELSWSLAPHAPPRPETVYLLPDRLRQLCAEYPAYVQAAGAEVVLCGFQAYIVEQWVPDRSRPYCTIVSHTGDKSHHVKVSAFRFVRDGSGALPRHVARIFERLAEDRTREMATEHGVLHLTNISTFNSLLNVIVLPFGAPAPHDAGGPGSPLSPGGGDNSSNSNSYDMFAAMFQLNLNLKRLGCGVRSALSLTFPTSAQKERFLQTYRTSPQIPFPFTVFELVTLAQLCLFHFGRFPRAHVDGMLCDTTVAALQDFVGGDGPFAGELKGLACDPAVFAALFSRLMGLRTKLAALSGAFREPLRDPLRDAEGFEAQLAQYQRAARLDATGRLDAATVQRIGADYLAAGNSPGLVNLPSLLKGSTREAPPQLAFADVPTTDTDTMIKVINNDRLRFLYKGRSKVEGLGGAGTITENLIFGGKELGKSLVRGFGAAAAANGGLAGLGRPGKFGADDKATAKGVGLGSPLGDDAAPQQTQQQQQQISTATESGANSNAGSSLASPVSQQGSNVGGNSNIVSISSNNNSGAPSIISGLGNSGGGGGGGGAGSMFGIVQPLADEERPAGANRYVRRVSSVFHFPKRSSSAQHAHASAAAASDAGMGTFRTLHGSRMQSPSHSQFTAALANAGEHGGGGAAPGHDGALFFGQPRVLRGLGRSRSADNIRAAGASGERAEARAAKRRKNTYHEVSLEVQRLGREQLPPEGEEATVQRRYRAVVEGVSADLGARWEEMSGLVSELRAQIARCADEAGRIDAYNKEWDGILALLHATQRSTLTSLASANTQAHKLGYELNFLEDKLNETSEMIDGFYVKLAAVEGQIPDPEQSRARGFWAWLIWEMDLEMAIRKLFV